MNTKFISGSKVLLSEWKSVRQELTSSISDYEQLKIVTEFWSKAPLSVRVLDWDSPSNWQDAWELINAMEFDESTIALAMFYTLLLGQDKRWTASRLKLKLVTDKSRQIQQLVLMVDNKFLLNLEYNSVVECSSIDHNISVQYQYNYDGKNHSII